MGRPGAYQAICLRIVRALNMIINTMKMSRAANSQAISARSAPLSITARNASFAYVKGNMYEIGRNIAGSWSIGQKTPDKKICTPKTKGMNCTI